MYGNVLGSATSVAELRPLLNHELLVRVWPELWTDRSAGTESRSPVLSRGPRSGRTADAGTGSGMVVADSGGSSSQVRPSRTRPLRVSLP